MQLKKLMRWTMVVMGALVVIGAPMAISGVAQETEEPTFEEPIFVYGPGAAGRFGPGLSGPHTRGFVPHRMLRQLDLSDDQWNQLRRLREDHFERNRMERDDLQKKQKAFWDEVQALEEGHGSAERVRAAAQEMAKAQAELAIVSSGLRTEMENSFMEILTPEQREKLKELRADAEARMKERWEQREERRRNFPES